MLKIQYTPEKTIDLHTEKILELPVVFCGILEEAAEYTAGGGANTPYDDACRTLEEFCPELLIPLINLAFGTGYMGCEEIRREANEHYLKNASGGWERRVTDGKFRILSKTAELYHLEFMSAAKNDMGFRMVEYGTYCALGEAETCGNEVSIRYPHSAVVYLQHNQNTPEFFLARILTDGGEAAYKIPVIRMQDYSLEQLLERRLYFFLPFYIFRYRKELEKIEHSVPLRTRLFSELEKIRGIPERLAGEGHISARTGQILEELMSYVAGCVTMKYQKIREGVDGIMGGKVLKLKVVEAWNSGNAEGRAEGLTAGRAEGRRTGVLETLTGLVKSRLLDETVAAERAGMSLAEFRKLLI